MSFLKKPGVKLFLGSVCFIASNVLTAKATMKYIEEKQKMDRELTKEESFKIFVKCFAPSVIAVLAGAGLIIKSSEGYNTSIGDIKKEYNNIAKDFGKHKEAVLKTFGFDGSKKIEEQTKQKVDDISKYCRHHVSEGSVLMMDPFSDPKNPVFVETSMVQIIDANHAFMRRIVTNPHYEDIVTINEWRELQSFDDLDIKGEEFGYSQEYLENINGNVWLDMEPEIRFDAKGNQYYWMNFRFEPCAGNSHNKPLL